MISGRRLEVLIAVAEEREKERKRIERDHPEATWDGRCFRYVQNGQQVTQWPTVGFEAVSMRFEISTSYVYALLRSLCKRGLVSIEENYLSDGDGSWPRRQWNYSLTLAGRRALNEWNEIEGDK